MEKIDQIRRSIDTQKEIPVILRFLSLSKRQEQKEPVADSSSFSSSFYNSPACLVRPPFRAISKMIKIDQ